MVLGVAKSMARLSVVIKMCELFFAALRGFPRDLSSTVGDLQVCRVLCADPNPGPDLAHRPRKQRRRLNRQNRVRKNSRLSSSGLSQNGQDGWEVSGKTVKYVVVQSAIKGLETGIYDNTQTKDRVKSRVQGFFQRLAQKKKV